MSHPEVLLSRDQVLAVIKRVQEFYRPRTGHTGSVYSETMQACNQIDAAIRSLGTVQEEGCATKLYWLRIWGDTYLVRAASQERAAALVIERFPGAPTLIPSVLERLRELLVEGEEVVFECFDKWRQAGDG